MSQFYVLDHRVDGRILTAQIFDAEADEEYECTLDVLESQASVTRWGVCVGSEYIEQPLRGLKDEVKLRVEMWAASSAWLQEAWEQHQSSQREYCDVG